LIAKGAGVEDREQAQAMRGLWVGVGRDAFVPADAGEVYWYELEGCRVVDQDGRELGIVHELIETGAHDVLVIRRGKEEILIPFATAYVMHVDVAGGVLTVDWDPNWS
jgi:16S rRNA processing protein RimM